MPIHGPFGKANVPNAEIVINTSSQLAGGNLRSDVVYVIDGDIDMLSDSIVVPQGGLNITGLGFGVSVLGSSTVGATLFIDDGVFSGDLFLNQLDIDMQSKASSKVFDLDNDENFNAVECTTVNFLNCVEIGVLDSYRQGLWTNVALIGCVDGLTMAGPWSGGFASLTAIIVGGVSPTFTGTLFKAGVGLTIGGRFRSDMNAEGLAVGGEFCDFAPANITNNARFQMTNVSVPAVNDAFPNIPASDVKARFRICDGTDNTYVGGQWDIGTAVATDLNTVAIGVPLKLAGITTYTDLQWFSGAVSNAFKYDGTQTIRVKVDGVLSLTGTNLDVINVKVRQWDDSASTYIDLSQSGGVTMNAAGRAEGVSLSGFATMDTNDRIEIWVENQIAARDVTAEIGGLVNVTERAS